MKKDHYDFDLEFQEYILASFVHDENFLIKHRDIIKPEYFDDEILCGIAQAVLSFFDKKKSMPDVASLSHNIKEFMMPGRKYGEYKETIENIYSKSGTNTAYYREQAVEFARRQAILDAVRQSKDLAEAGEYEEIASLVTRAVNTGIDYHDLTYDFFGNINERAKAYNERRKGSNTRITTGIPELDRLIQGGLDKGELGIVVAPPKHGKSTMLFNISASAVMAGYSVLHVNLEMKKKMVITRYDCRFLGTSMRSLHKKPKSFLKAMKILKKKLTSRLKVVEYPTKRLSLANLKSLVSSIDGLDMIIVDYADLMRPPRFMKDKRLELIEIYEQLRGMAGELDLPIWTASQSNRQSMGAKVITMDMIAEAFDKIAIADIAISVCQTVQEARIGKMRLYIMANRLGAGEEQIECDVDWKTATIRSSVEDDDDL